MSSRLDEINEIDFSDGNLQIYLVTNVCVYWFGTWIGLHFKNLIFLSRDKLIFKCYSPLVLQIYCPYEIGCYVIHNF